MKKIIIGILLIVLFLVIGTSFIYIKNKDKNTVFIYSDRTMLDSLWYHYKLNYLEGTQGRTLDKQRENITTSEGQSYTLLRAVWEDDKDIFDKSWIFTRDNLRRQNDHLFSWKFGARPDGTYGILTEEGGYNTASDGDSDIALALIFAYNRWQEKSYLEEALPLISDIWEKEVVMIQGKPYLASNDLEKKAEKEYIISNPSYFAPYTYRMFAALDDSHDWMGLVDSSYAVLEKSMTESLGSGGNAGLPPDWIFIDKKTGELLEIPTERELTANYGYDALRIPWRLALDWQWYGEPRAKESLSRMSFLGDQWNQNQYLSAIYSHTGEDLTHYESLASYGGNLGYFLIQDPQAANKIYSQKLAAQYDIKTFTWKMPQSYYDENFAWFGMALYQGALINLSERKK